jgi:beta-lactamase regulating signal transducer with metallopeptidase domain
VTSSAFLTWLDTTTLGYVLLHFLWQGTLIAAALSLTLRRLEPRDAPRRYLASCTALLFMALLPVGTWFYPNSSTPAFSNETVSNAPSLEPSTLSDTSSADTLSSQPLPPTPPAHEHIQTSPPLAASAIFHLDLEPLLPYFVLSWLFGVTLLALRLSGSLIIAHRLRTHGTTLAPPHLQNALKHYTRLLALKRPIRLLTSSTAPVPMVIGWLRPVILVPTSAITGLTTGQLETILAHELAHIRRHDYLVNLLQHLAETLLFYHPAVWWVSNQIRKEREHCCDDLAVSLANGDTLTYATALAELENLKKHHGLALAAGDGSLLQRIQRLTGYKPQPTPKLTPHGAIQGLSGLLALISIMAMLAASFTGQTAKAQNTETQERRTLWVTATNGVEFGICLSLTRRTYSGRNAKSPGDTRCNTRITQLHVHAQR